MKGLLPLFAAVAVMSVLVGGCGTENVVQSDELSVEQLLRKEATELWTQGDLSRIPEVYADTVVTHYGDQVTERTHEDARNLVMTWRAAFPDFKMAIQDLVVSGDTAVARYTVTGTHLGELWGNGPTGRQFRVEQIYIIRIQNGRIADTWGVWDQYAFMQQLGFIPE
jgi:steroid delta-isomerase-like uncharacterized protein